MGSNFWAFFTSFFVDTFSIISYPYFLKLMLLTIMDTLSDTDKAKLCEVGKELQKRKKKSISIGFVLNSW